MRIFATALGLLSATSLFTACDGPVVVGRSVALGTCVGISDPAGDVGNQVPGWEDIVAGQVCLADGIYAFTWTMAASIPAQIELPSSGPKFANWLFHLDTDPSTAPAGSPVGQNQPLAPEFMVAVTGDESGLAGTLYDRRPLLLGQPWIVTAIDFSVADNQIVATVPSALLGDPPTFNFAEHTVNWTSHFPSDAGHIVDVTVPNWNPFP
jgi:hypothetical protein